LADDLLSLAATFPPPDRQTWLKLVEKTLGGAGPETLATKTRDGLTIEALYRDGPASPVRPAGGDPERPWDIRTCIRHPDPVRANSDLLADLEGGCASAVVAIDPSGESGVAVASSADLARVLQGVVLELAPIALDAGFLGPMAADWLAAQAKGAPAAPLAFHLDPLGAFAVQGSSPGAIDAHVAQAAHTALRQSRVYPKAGLFRASGVAVHEAGGSEASELAFALACGLAYAKAADAAGAADPFAGVVMSLAASSEYFVTLAKLRAARLLWAKVAGGPLVIEARSSLRMLSRMDAWTNMLRLSAAGFGAATGGADAIVLGAYTDATGHATAFARRQSRNTQLVLMEESHLGRVADPAGGAWFIEDLTDQLARAAWMRFQAIEAVGGAAAALKSGLIARDVEIAAKAEAEAVIDKSRHILGVTRFLDADPAPIEVETPDTSTFAKPGPDIAQAGPDDHCPALTPVRLAAAFEAA